MAERAQPTFTVDEGAPPGTSDAFVRLAALVIEDPVNAPDAFHSAGKTTAEVKATAEKLSPDDESLPARAARMLVHIFAQQYDLEVDLGPSATAAMHRLDSRVERDARRVIYVASFVGDLAASEQAYQQANPQQPDIPTAGDLAAAA